MQGYFHLTLGQLSWNDICAHFRPFNNVAAMFRVSAHGAGACAFVEAAVYLFVRKLEAGELAGEGWGGLHVVKGGVVLMLVGGTGTIVWGNNDCRQRQLLLWCKENGSNLDHREVLARKSKMSAKGGNSRTSQAQKIHMRVRAFPCYLENALGGY